MVDTRNLELLLLIGPVASGGLDKEEEEEGYQMKLRTFSTLLTLLPDGGRGRDRWDGGEFTRTYCEYRITTDHRQLQVLLLLLE